jgi:hypothetical protein
MKGGREEKDEDCKEMIHRRISSGFSAVGPKYTMCEALYPSSLYSFVVWYLGKRELYLLSLSRRDCLEFCTDPRTPLERSGTIAISLLNVN